MSWTAPRTYVANEIVTAAILNVDLRDNLLALSTHAHTGAAGDGNDELSGIDIIDFGDQAGSPATTGRMQRNGVNLEWYDGASVIAMTEADAAAATPSPRTIGTGALQAAAGDHDHALGIEVSGDDVDDAISVAAAATETELETASLSNTGVKIFVARFHGTFEASDGSLAGSVNLYIGGVLKATQAFAGQTSLEVTLVGEADDPGAAMTARVDVTNDDNPGTITGATSGANIPHLVMIGVGYD